MAAMAAAAAAGLVLSKAPSLGRASSSAALHGSSHVRTCLLRASRGSHGRSLAAASPSAARFGRRRNSQSGAARCAASGASSADLPADEEDPYAVLGVNPLKGFDAAMVAHRKKHKEAVRKGDKEAMDRYDRAYNKIMMKQLNLRRQGMTLGSMEVSNDIKYADKRAIFPWLPRSAPVERKELFMNAVISAIFGGWIIAVRSAEWRPLQFIIFTFIFRLFLKLKSLAGSAPKSSEEEGGGGKERDDQNRSILLRSLGLVFGSVGLASLGYAAVVKAYVAMGSYPYFVATGQELFITVFSAAALFVISSYYR